MKRTLETMIINLLFLVLLVQQFSALQANTTDLSQTETKEDALFAIDINVSTERSIVGNVTYILNDTTTEHPYESFRTSEKIYEEVSDLLDVPTAPYKSDANRESVRILNAQIDLSIVSSNDRYNTEDVLTKKELNNVKNRFENRNEEHFVAVQSKLAVILAGVFVVICIFGYGTLLFWRRFLENRYGNRQMLVTDDDDQKEDLKYFTI